MLKSLDTKTALITILATGFSVALLYATYEKYSKRNEKKCL